MKQSDEDFRDRRLSTGAPRWVRVFGVIALVLVLLFVLLHLNGHGFGSHGMKDMPGMDVKGKNHLEHGAQPP